MKKIMGLAAIVLIAGSVKAQTGKAQTLPDAQDVNKLCGCFEVEFKYAETFSPDKKYKFHDREEISGGTELIMPVEVTDKKIVMQHLLVITDSMIIKHWREDWTYENPTIWKYKGDKVWVKEQLKPEEVKGKWTQAVWEVSDAPRYQGAAQWMTIDGKTMWQNTADAPLPRREYSVRSDYNILKRSNRLVLNNEGWTHEQDNQKIIRSATGDKLLVEEKGVNTYKKVDDSQCAAAKVYWEKNKVYWTKVRNAWEDYTATHLTIELKTEVNGKVLHDYLFEQAKDYASGKITAADIDSKIKTQLESFFGKDSKAVAQH
ncbi:MAG: DUF6607 family protein [Chitinophagaceae bacterium]